MVLVPVLGLLLSVSTAGSLAGAPGVAAAPSPGSTAPDVEFKVNMDAFLARHDSKWEFAWRAGERHIPTFWYESAYIGNGVMGAMLTVENRTCGCPLLCDKECRCPDVGDGGRACVADHCAAALCPVSDPADPGEPGHPGLTSKNGTHGALICPPETPACADYTYGVRMGSCVRRADSNASSPCPLPEGEGPGQPGPVWELL